MKTTSKAIWALLGLFLVVGILASGCGGGGGGNAIVPVTQTPTPVGTPVNLTVFKGLFMGTAPAGSQIAFNLSGTDTAGSTWSGSFTMVSDGPLVFESQNVYKSRILITLKNVPNGTSASVVSSYYFLASNMNLYKIIDSDGLTSMPTSQGQIADTVNVGGSGALWALSNSDGTTETTTWKLNGDVNGISKFVLSTAGMSGASVTSLEDDTFYLDSAGNPFRYTVTLTVSGVTVTLSGNKI
jgi:hypothetical protein